MKKFFVFFVAVSAIACTDKKIVDDPGTPDFSGTMTVLAGTPAEFTMSGIEVNLTIKEGKADIEMLQIKFAQQMPVLIDITIPGVTVTDNSIGGRNLSGSGIVPLFMGAEYAERTVESLSGSLSGDTLYLSITVAGSGTMTYTGTKITR